MLDKIIELVAAALILMVGGYAVLSFAAVAFS